MVGYLRCEETVKLLERGDMNHSKTSKSVDRHDGAKDVPALDGGRMRQELKMIGVDPECGDPRQVFASLKTWTLEDFRNPLRRMAATNLVRQFMVVQLCKPNDSRPNPDLPHEKAAVQLVKELEFFVARCADWQYRIDSVRDLVAKRDGLLWFDKNHREILRRFEQYLTRPDLAG